MRLLPAMAPLLLSSAPNGIRMLAKEAVPPPSIAQCLEAAFVPAVMGIARGDVTELKLFIAAAQGGYRTGEKIEGLSAAMDALPVQTAGRPLAPEESQLRTQWTSLVYLTLEQLAAAKSKSSATADGDAAALVPSAMRAANEGMVAKLLSAKRESTPLSSLDVDEVASTPTGTSRSPTEEALLRQAMRVVFVTLDNVDAEADAGTRADSPKAPPKPYIPGTG